MNGDNTGTHSIVRMVIFVSLLHHRFGFSVGHPRLSRESSSRRLSVELFRPSWRLHPKEGLAGSIVAFADTQTLNNNSQCLDNSCNEPTYARFATHFPNPCLSFSFLS